MTVDDRPADAAPDPGDEGAKAGFERMFRAHYRAVRGFVWRRTGNTSATDEIVAEVFTIAWTKYPQLRDLPDRSVQVWLWRVATFVGLRSYTAAGRYQRLVERLQTEPIPSVDPGPEDDHQLSELHSDGLVQRALDKLDDGDREILQLVAWEQLNGPELAMLLGITPQAARLRLMRARQRFREHFESMGGVR